MKRTMKSLCALLIAVAAGCGGGSSVPPAPGAFAPNAGAGAKQTTPAPATARARFEIRIPRRHAHFVSPNTQSLTVTVNGGKPVTRNLTPGSKGCTTAGGATQCSFTIGVPSGANTFRVATFESTDGNGSMLSQGSVTQKIKRGTLGVIPITLQGIVASIGVTLGNSAPAAGTATTTPVYVTAFDASHAMIVGPGTYNAPITLTDSDSSGITSVSAASISSPGGSGTLTYSGGSIFHATIGASASGVSTVTTATFAPIPTIMASFDIPAALGVETAALAIAGGPDGNVWYTAYGSTNSAIVKLSPSGASTSFISGVAPGLTSGGKYPGIAAGPDGNVWFTDVNNKLVGKITPSGIVTEYAAPGGICPNRIVAGPPGDGGLWFTSTCTASIGHITTSGTTAAYPLAGGGTQFQGVILGKDGNLYVADLTNESIGQAKIAAGVLSSYSEFIVGPNPIDGTFDDKLYGLAQTSDGQLWFANQGCIPSTIGSIQIAPTFSASTVKQFTTTHGCSLPTFMVPSPDGSAIFLALWNYPVLEVLTPTGVGTTPTQQVYGIQVPTPNGVFQAMWDVTVGPNGNVWATNNTQAVTAPANIIEMAY